MLEWNARRLAVLDRDIDAIIRTHARDRKVAAWLEDTAKAFEETGEIDLAIDWAKQATHFDHGHQSLKAAGSGASCWPTPSTRSTGSAPRRRRSGRRP